MGTMISSPELAQLVAAELARHLTDVVICPGSRNSPLSLALLARSDIRVHTRIDERSASFLALGMARATRRHVGVVTTSGTAVANCLPAMVEASHSHVPLAMISADRPERLLGTGANQTITQRGIFGDVADTVQVTQERVQGEELHQLRSVFDEAFQRGQVHINVALDTPLVDGLPAVVGDAENKLLKAGPARLERVDHGEIEVDLSKNTIVIAGDEAWETEELAEVPTIAEPTAPAPFRPIHPLAAGVFSKQQVSAEGYVVDTKPAQVVVVGHPTLHRGVLALIEDPEVELLVLTRNEVVTDPARRAAAVGSRVKVSGAPSAQWVKLCEAASELAAESVREVLDNEEFGFTGLHAMAAVGDTLATGDTLFLGSSNPVRDASLVGLPFDGVDTFAARGTAGIDGTTSQAIGVALAVQAAHPDEIRAPCSVAVVGDVTFLHDVGGLLIGPDSARPENLTIVVANDDGGGIFETLEIGGEDYRPSFERAFGTPHGVDIESLCAAYEVDYLGVDSLQGLIEALIDTTDIGGFHVIEARTTRTTRRAMHEALAAKVAMR